MIETFVRYVSTQTSVKVLRIAETAIASGIPTAGSVPKTKSRMTRAPAPPISASVKTLGPLLPSLDASKSGISPVRCVVTPAGALAFSAARVSLTCPLLEKVFSPDG